MGVKLQTPPRSQPVMAHPNLRTPLPGTERFSWPFRTWSARSIGPVVRLDLPNPTCLIRQDSDSHSAPPRKTGLKTFSVHWTLPWVTLGQKSGRTGKQTPERRKKRRRHTRKNRTHTTATRTNRPREDKERVVMGDLCRHPPVIDGEQCLFSFCSKCHHVGWNVALQVEPRRPLSVNTAKAKNKNSLVVLEVATHIVEKEEPNTQSQLGSWQLDVSSSACSCLLLSPVVVLRGGDVPLSAAAHPITHRSSFEHLSRSVPTCCRRHLMSLCRSSFRPTHAEFNSRTLIECVFRREVGADKWKTMSRPTRAVVPRTLIEPLHVRFIRPSNLEFVQ